MIQGSKGNDSYSQGSWGSGFAILVPVVGLDPWILVHGVLKGVNSHRDRGGRGSQSWYLSSVWTLGSSCGVLKGVNSHRDRGGRGSQSWYLSSVWTLGSSCMKFLKVSTVTGIVGVGVRNPGTCRRFGPLDPRAWSSKSVNSHRDRGSRGSQSWYLSSVWTLGSSCMEFEKCQQSQGSWGSGFAILGPVVGLDPWILVHGVRKVSTVAGIVGVGVRNPGTCRRFGPLDPRAWSSKSVNSHRDRGGRGSQSWYLSSVWTLGSSCMEFEKCQQSQGSWGSGSRSS